MSGLPRPWTMQEASIALGSCGLCVRLKRGDDYHVVGIHESSVSLVLGDVDEDDLLASDDYRSVSYSVLLSDYTMPCGSPCGTPSEARKLPDRDDRCYSLTMSHRQAAVVREALEAYSRMKSGQFNHAIGDQFLDRYCTGGFSHENADRIFGEIKAMIFPELSPNESFGVGSRVYPEATVAWDVQQVIRHRLAWDRLADEGKETPDRYNVCFNKPMAFSGESLPTIEAVIE
ncbi:MAG: hypothetical protein AAGJ40_09555 [Planctomycetota bacterium]